MKQKKEGFILRSMVKIINEEINSISDNAVFDGVYVQYPQSTDSSLLLFKYGNSGGGVYCNTASQNIIDTIQKLIIGKDRRDILLKNVDFIKSKAEEITKLIDKTRITENEIIQLGNLLLSIKEKVELPEEQIIEYAKKLKDLKEDYEEMGNEHYRLQSLALFLEQDKDYRHRLEEQVEILYDEHKETKKKIKKIKDNITEAIFANCTGIDWYTRI